LTGVEHAVWFDSSKSGTAVKVTCSIASLVKHSRTSKALWRSWLARRPVTAEVAGSSPVRVADAYPIPGIGYAMR
jgi:hypothetical protein